MTDDSQPKKCNIVDFYTAIKKITFSRKGRPKRANFPTHLVLHVFFDSEGAISYGIYPDEGWDSSLLNKKVAIETVLQVLMGLVFDDPELRPYTDSLLKDLVEAVADEQEE